MLPRFGTNLLWEVQLGRTRLEVNVKLKANFNAQLFAMNVVVTIPVPDNTANADLQITQGVTLMRKRTLSCQMKAEILMSCCCNWQQQRDCLSNSTKVFSCRSKHLARGMQISWRDFACCSSSRRSSTEGQVCIVFSLLQIIKIQWTADDYKW